MYLPTDFVKFSLGFGANYLFLLKCKYTCRPTFTERQRAVEQGRGKHTATSHATVTTITHLYLLLQQSCRQMKFNFMSLRYGRLEIRTVKVDMLSTVQ